MKLEVLLAVLGGALLHATWNLLIKRSADTRRATAGVYVCAGTLAALCLPWLPAPARASWPYLAGSTVLELIYGGLLAAAYRIGDLSHAYPLMRGTAPLLVALGSVTLVGEPLSWHGWLGVVLVSAGILSLIVEARRQRHSAAATRLALLNAFAIAGYTTLDGVGVRLSGHALSYGLWLFLLIGTPWLAWSLRRYGTGERVRAPAAAAPASAPASDWWPELVRDAVAGVCALGSYVVALWAMTRAPIALVALALALVAPRAPRRPGRGRRRGAPHVHLRDGRRGARGRAVC